VNGQPTPQDERKWSGHRNDELIDLLEDAYDRLARAGMELVSRDRKIAALETRLAPLEARAAEERARRWRRPNRTIRAFVRGSATTRRSRSREGPQ
jgi:hypothetical protein